MRTSRGRDFAILFGDGGRICRQVLGNGSENEVRYDQTFNVLTRILRDGQGRAVSVEGEDFSKTSIGRNQDGELVFLRQGKGELFKLKDVADAFLTSLSLVLRIHGQLDVEPSGDIIWRGASGNQRIVRPNGDVEAIYTDGSREISSGDRSIVRYRYAPGNEIAEVTVYKNGSVEVVYDDGLIQRQEAFSNLIRDFEVDLSSSRTVRNPSKILSGRLQVSSSGNLSIDESDARRFTVFHRTGQTTRFKFASDSGWNEVGTRHFFSDRQRFIQRLIALGAAIPGRAPNAIGMEDGERQPSPLLLRLEPILTRNISSRRDPDGSREWRFDNAESKAPHISKLYQRFDGGLTLTRSDGTTVKADEGPIADLTAIKKQLQTLTDQWYEPAAVTNLIDELDQANTITQHARQKSYNLERLLVFCQRWIAEPNVGNRLRAAVLIRRMAEAGHPAAQRVLAELYTSGTIVAKNNEWAAEWWRKAAELGDSAAQKRLTTQEPVTTEPLDKLAQAQKWVLGKAGPGKVQEGLAIVLEAARRDDRRAQRYLAELYETGAGVDLDLKQADAWYQKAALGGDAEAIYRIGIAAFSGRDIDGRKTTPDLGRARSLIRLAAEKGSARAKAHQLSKDMQRTTQQSKGDKPVATDSAPTTVKIPAGFLDRAKKGDAKFQFMVGMRYYDARQYPEAKEWLQKAAAQNHEIAKAVLKDVEIKLNQPKR